MSWFVFLWYLSKPLAPIFGEECSAVQWPTKSIMGTQVWARHMMLRSSCRWLRHFCTIPPWLMPSVSLRQTRWMNLPMICVCFVRMETECRLLIIQRLALTWWMTVCSGFGLAGFDTYPNTRTILVYYEFGSLRNLRPPESDQKCSF